MKQVDSMAQGCASRRTLVLPVLKYRMLRESSPAYLGVTPPISTAGPSKREDEVTVTLMQELRDQNRFESEEEARTR